MRVFGLDGTELYNLVSSPIIQNTWDQQKKKKKFFGKFFECCFYNSKLKKLSLRLKIGNKFFEFPKLQTWISVALWLFWWICGTHVQRPVELDSLPLILLIALTFLFLISFLHILEILISFLFLISFHFLTEVLGQPSVGAMMRCKQGRLKA